MAMVYGNTTNYGQKIGILMLETHFPRVPGDIGNATTFPFPVAYRVVKGASSQRVVLDADPELIRPFVDAAKELVAEGCKAIVTSCGFMAIFQKEMAAQVGVPVLSSSLLQVGLVSSMLQPDQMVGILTARAKSLGDRHFEGVGIRHVPKVVYGIDDTAFGQVFFNGLDHIDMDLAEREMLGVVDNMLQENPSIGAIVLECTNMPPFAAAIRRKTGLPVFDVVTLIQYVHDALTGPAYIGYM